MTVFILDFDRTIADDDTQNLMSQTKDRDSAWEVLKEVKPIGGSMIWRQVFRQLIDDGHPVAIASFNSFDILIYDYLNKVIGLTEAELAKIHIEAWTPCNPETANKDKHIEAIKIALNFKGDNNEIVFVDDDTAINIPAAKKLGCRTISAIGTSHINTIIKMSQATSKHSLSIYKSSRLDPAKGRSSTTCIIS
jgi:hypothetical protein